MRGAVIPPCQLWGHGKPQPLHPCRTRVSCGDSTALSALRSHHPCVPALLPSLHRQALVRFGPPFLCQQPGKVLIPNKGWSSSPPQAEGLGGRSGTGAAAVSDVQPGCVQRSLPRQSAHYRAEHSEAAALGRTSSVSARLLETSRDRHSGDPGM